MAFNFWDNLYSKANIKKNTVIKARMFLLFSDAFFCDGCGGFFFLNHNSFGSLSNCQIHAPVTELCNRFGGLVWYCSTVNMSVYSFSFLIADLYFSINYIWLLSLFSSSSNSLFTPFSFVQYSKIYPILCTSPHPPFARFQPYLPQHSQCNIQHPGPASFLSSTMLPMFFTLASPPPLLVVLNSSSSLSRSFLLLQPASDQLLPSYRFPSTAVVLVRLWRESLQH